MAIRYNTGASITRGVPPLHGGFESESSPVDLSIPTCGIEDVDTALFNIFDKEIPFVVGGSDGAQLKKVPVIFAAGEKWALLKNNRPLRDRNGTLIIPLITIVRTGMTQEMNTDIAGRGINQQTGELVIKRRLDASDRNYQSLINKLNIEHQNNVATNLTLNEGLMTLENQSAVQSQGDQLTTDLTDNVYELITIPSPQFYTATYEVTFWTQYVLHMNSLTEALISSFLPQAQSWKLQTPKGYWFIASVDGGAFNIETNFDDMSQEERFVKLKFNVKVPAYLFATSTPGSPIPIRRHISAPKVSFETPDSSGQTFQIDNQTLGSDDPTLPFNTEKNISNRKDNRDTGVRILDGRGKISQDDPALKGLPRGYKEKVFDAINQSFGETVYRTR